MLFKSRLRLLLLLLGLCFFLCVTLSAEQETLLQQLLLFISAPLRDCCWSFCWRLLDPLLRFFLLGATLSACGEPSLDRVCSQVDACTRWVLLDVLKRRQL